ncbi:hypothetical protein E2542_SST00895 [Spatholobus suberectus]|nr:hypothetical protein E2542_SST00895 [Spatholobus suberectus]
MQPPLTKPPPRHASIITTINRTCLPLHISVLIGEDPFTQARDRDYGLRSGTPYCSSAILCYTDKEHPAIIRPGGQTEREFRRRKDVNRREIRIEVSTSFPMRRQWCRRPWRPCAASLSRFHRALMLLPRIECNQGSRTRFTVSRKNIGDLVKRDESKSLPPRKGRWQVICG